MYSTELLIQTLITGLMVGVLYALMALGITFIYSIVRTINWTMGEFYMIGSYIQFVVVQFLLGPRLWWLAVIISTAGTFVIGYLLEPILIKPMYARPLQRRDDYATVVTIALLLMLRSLAVALGGPNQYRPASDLPIMWVGPLPQEGARVMASVCAVLALGIFWIVLNKTWIGLALRSVAQNRVAAQTSGVDVLRIDAMAFAIGVALAGLAGALLAPLFMVFPTNGAVTTVKGFEIIVIGGLVANDDVDVTLAAGEIRGLIGPNGAGKTTFVNLVTGIETPDQGSVRLGEGPITGLPPHRIAERGLVRSFQHARIFPSLTVIENLIVPYMASPATSDVAAGMARAEELLRLATLTPRADASAGALSGGQRMLLMACAGFMIPGIRVYVLDEPFAGINPVVKDTLIELIRHENATHGVTFLIVSHEMEIVRHLCPKVTVMIQGKVAAEGSLDEVAQREDVITAYLGRVSA